MRMVKRPRYMLLMPFDNPMIDIERFLKGDLEVDTVPVVAAISILKGQVFKLTSSELELVAKLPGDRWVSEETLVQTGSQSQNLIRELALKGIVLIDDKEEPFTGFRNNDELLWSIGWDIYAATFHFMTKWSQVDFPFSVEEDTEGKSLSFDKSFEGFEKPPHHFHKRKDAISTYPLAVIDRQDAIFDLLLQRKTSRSFKPEKPISGEDFSTILKYVFGCHGYFGVPITLSA